MFGNIVLTMIRNMRRNLLFTMINVVGLSIGIAVSLLILMWIRDEWSVDAHHENGARTYRVVEIQNAKGRNPTHVPYRPQPLAEAMELDFPAVEQAVRIGFMGSVEVSVDDRQLFVDRAFYVEDGYFDVVTNTVTGGDPDTVLDSPYNTLITRELARKMFGDENPVGQSYRLQQHQLVVAGIIEDTGTRDHLAPDLLVSYPSAKALEIFEEDFFTNWGSNNIFTYVVLKPGADPAELEAQFHDFMSRHKDAEYNNVSYLQNIQDIYLHSELVGYSGPWLRGNQRNLYMFGAIALFLLLIACFNFMNLATAQATGRSVEVGIRKTIGGSRGQLMGQFFAESMLLTVLSFVVALALVELSLPYFNTLCGKQLGWSGIIDNRYIIFLPVLLLVVGLTAGSYPAVYLSRFRPAQVLRGGGSKGSRGLVRFRTTLVIIQFSVTIFLLGATGVVFYQLRYVQSRDLGYEKEGSFVVHIERDMEKEAYRLKERLARIPGVQTVSVSSSVPGSGATGEWSSEPLGYEGDENWTIPLIMMDGDYLDTFGIELVSGRVFVTDGSGASKSQVMINESTARQFGWTEPLGKQLRIPGWSEEPLEVVGLVKDYHIKSLHDNLEPVLFVPNREGQYVSMRLTESADPAGVRNACEDAWHEFAPGRAYRSYFLDEITGALYRNDERAGRIVGHGAGLAILVACLGLFGLAVFETRQRTKEIGVRKVLGATVSRIVSWLSMRFVRWLIVANLLALPACAWIMGRWLTTFAYRVDNVLPVYVATVLLSVLVGLLTVAIQAYRAAIANPVSALKYE